MSTSQWLHKVRRRAGGGVECSTQSDWYGSGGPGVVCELMNPARRDSQLQDATLSCELRNRKLFSLFPT